MIILRILRVVFLGFIFSVLFACSGAGGGGSNATRDSSSTDDEVIWASSNPNVAVVDSNGLATVKAEGGIDYITATYEGVTSDPVMLKATAARVCKYKSFNSDYC